MPCNTQVCNSKQYVYQNYDKNKELLYIQYLDVKHLYRWEMSQKLPVDGFKSKKEILKFNATFIKKNYNEDSYKGYILEADVKYPKRFYNLHCDLPFLLERMRIDKCNKLVFNLYHKNNYVVHIRALKQALDQEIILKKKHKVIQFNQEAWLKPYID